MSLSKFCSSCFDSATRSRGDAYFSAGRVRIIDVEHSTVFAEVRGSLAVPYDVEIDFEGVSYGEITADCDCPMSGWRKSYQLRLP